MDRAAMNRKNRIAQWAFDTGSLLGRFHLWLEDVAVEWIQDVPRTELSDSISFVDARMERMLIMTAAVTALGTRLFGRYGEGIRLDRRGLNQVKKDADAISAYAMSESLLLRRRLTQRRERFPQHSRPGPPDGFCHALPA